MSDLHTSVTKKDLHNSNENWKTWTVWVDHRKQSNETMAETEAREFAEYENCDDDWNKI